MWVGVVLCYKLFPDTKDVAGVANLPLFLGSQGSVKVQHHPQNFWDLIHQRSDRQTYRDRERDTERGRDREIENVFKEMTENILKFVEKHKPTDSRSLVNPKRDKPMTKRSHQNVIISHMIVTQTVVRAVRKKMMYYL